MGLDEDLRRRERALKADPSDPAALRLHEGRRRTGQPPLSEYVLQARLPARSISLTSRATVWALEPDGAVTELGRGPGLIEVPEHRVFWLDQQRDPLDAAVADVRSQRIPGLVIGHQRRPAAFSGLPVSHLGLSGRLTEEVLEDLRTLEELVWFSWLAVRPCLSPDLSSLASLPGLVSLSLEGVSRETLSSVRGLGRLRELALFRGAALDGDALQAIGELGNLVSLKLEAVYGLDLSHFPLSHLPLGRLSLLDTAIESESFRAILPSADSLERLDLGGSKRLRPDDLASISRFTRIRSLGLRGANVDDLVLARLRPLEALEELDLSETRIDDQALRLVATFKKLVSLRLARCSRLTRVGLERLRGLPNLRRVVWSGDSEPLGLPGVELVHED